MAYSVLTVCTGNICRSPMAQALLRDAFAAAGLDVTVESAGISDEEAGNGVDPRAQQALATVGVKPPKKHRARAVSPKDLERFDLVIPMTAYHARDIRRLAGKAKGQQVPEVRLMRSFDQDAPQVDDIEDEHLLDVEDPWYGGAQEFAECLAQLTAAVPGVVAYVEKQLAS